MLHYYVCSVGVFMGTILWVGLLQLGKNKILATLIINIMGRFCI